MLPVCFVVVFCLVYGDWRIIWWSAKLQRPSEKKKKKKEKKDAGVILGC
jgi:hypothetical protein